MQEYKYHSVMNMGLKQNIKKDKSLIKADYTKIVSIYEIN